MNVLPLIKNDYLDLCSAMIHQNLHTQKLDIIKYATVCKYVVPQGYGINSMVDKRIDVDESLIKESGSLIYYASVNKKNDYITTTSSRSLAIVGLAETIEKAEQKCQAENGLRVARVPFRRAGTLVECMPFKPPLCPP